MTRPFIVLGERHSHGCTVTNASVHRQNRRQGIARGNDTVSYPLHGSNHIEEGENSATIDNQAAARDGHKTHCGTVLIASQSSTSCE
ncbi:PAAR domain-containing protein [Paraburkholderia bannensis]|uniref:PAAR domain-containing protein n=1 Tax=Paraburkholderia bannensis TaxID=765414 RepID=UPI002AB7A4DB|nr:PAAR domain-containing protein [Paraburkholderia bannensis]